MESKKYGWMTSSANNAKLSLTIKSFIPLIIFILPMLGIVNIGESDIVGAIDQVGVAILAVMTAYGAIRRIKNLALGKNGK